MRRTSSASDDDLKPCRSSLLPVFSSLLRRSVGRDDRDLIFDAEIRLVRIAVLQRMLVKSYEAELIHWRNKCLDLMQKQ